MLTFDLRTLLQEYEARTGIHLSYSELAKLTNLSVDTLKSLGTRATYNATLQSLSIICSAVGANPIKYLTWNSEQNGNDISD